MSSTDRYKRKLKKNHPLEDMTATVTPTSHDERIERIEHIEKLLRESDLKGVQRSLVAGILEGNKVMMFYAHKELKGRGEPVDADYLYKIGQEFRTEVLDPESMRKIDDAANQYRDRVQKVSDSGMSEIVARTLLNT